MAKKDAPDGQEEDYTFVPPDFDEDGFIHKEMVSFRTTVALFLVGIAAALVSWGIHTGVDGARTGWFLGILVVAAAFAGLRPLYKALKFDIRHWARREWIGSAFLLFFTWLGFFMVLINPPISDFADPDGEFYALPSVGQAGMTLELEFHVSDNAGVADADFTVTTPDGSTLDGIMSVADHKGILTIATPMEGTYTVNGTVTDTKGRVTHVGHEVNVVADVLRVQVDDLTAPGGEVVVETRIAKEDTYAVYLIIEGTSDRVYLSYDDGRGVWSATDNHAGWLPGENNFTVVLQEKNRFYEDTVLVQGARVVDGPFSVVVDEPGDSTKGQPKRANPTEPTLRNTPGVELPLLAVAVLGVAAVARKRSG